jgi:hypothetical protein
VIVAGLLGDDFVDEVPGRLEIEEGDLRLQERCVDPLSDPQNAPFQPRRSECRWQHKVLRKYQQLLLRRGQDPDRANP